MKIAVITGASSGIGREFVRRLDKEQAFDELWLVARREERLAELARETRARVRPLALDLTDPGSFEQYGRLLEREQPEIAVLVNAGGFGRFKAFAETELDVLLRMIDLNDKALVAMTYLSIPYMKPGSCIYQMGSGSSFQPVPYMGVYGASKAFVLSFSRALNVELRDRGVRVMAVCPGWIKTEFFDHAVSDDTVSYFDRYYSPEEVAAKALRDMSRDRDVSVLGFPERMRMIGTKLLPHRLVMRIWCRQQKH